MSVEASASAVAEIRGGPRQHDVAITSDCLED